MMLATLRLVRSVIIPTMDFIRRWGAMQVKRLTCFCTIMRIFGFNQPISTFIDSDNGVI